MRVLMRAALAVWSPMLLIGGLGTGVGDSLASTGREQGG